MCPYDNAVAEATYKVIKTEFVNNQIFETQEQLSYEFADYVNGSPGSAKHHPQLLGNGYNNHRIHSSLGYLSPVDYRKNTLKKVVYFSVDNPLLICMSVCLIYIAIGYAVFILILRRPKIDGKLGQY